MINEIQLNKIKSKGIKFYNFEELERMGSKNLIKEEKPNKNDILTIIYTSGSTGIPKVKKFYKINFIN